MQKFRSFLIVDGISASSASVESNAIFQILLARKGFVSRQTSAPNHNFSYSAPRGQEEQHHQQHRFLHRPTQH